MNHSRLRNKDIRIFFMQFIFLIMLVIWTDFQYQFSFSSTLILVVSALLCILGLYLSLWILYAPGLITVNIFFIYASLGFDFTYSNIIQMVVFQTLCLLLFESFYFWNHIGTFAPKNPIYINMIKNVSTRYVSVLLEVSAITIVISFGMLYFAFGSIIFIPHFITIIVFAIILLCCLIVIHIAREGRYN